MEKFILVDQYSKHIPDLIPNQTKAVIHNKMCTFIRTNYLGNLIFSEDDIPVNEHTVSWNEVSILFRNEFVDSDIASDKMREKVKILLGKEK